MKFQIGQFGVSIPKLDLATGKIEMHILGNIGGIVVNIHFNNAIKDQSDKTELLVEIWNRSKDEEESANS